MTVNYRRAKGRHHFDVKERSKSRSEALTRLPADRPGDSYLIGNSLGSDRYHQMRLGERQS